MKRQEETLTKPSKASLSTNYIIEHLKENSFTEEELQIMSIDNLKLIFHTKNLSWSVNKKLIKSKIWAIECIIEEQLDQEDSIIKLSSSLLPNLDNTSDWESTVSLYENNESSNSLLSKQNPPLNNTDNNSSKLLTSNITLDPSSNHETGYESTMLLSGNQDDDYSEGNQDNDYLPLFFLLEVAFNSSCQHKRVFKDLEFWAEY